MHPILEWNMIIFLKWLFSGLGFESFCNAGDSDEDKTADDFGGPPSHEKLEELKKAVADAEAKYEEQKKAFEVCIARANH